MARDEGDGEEDGGIGGGSGVDGVGVGGEKGGEGGVGVVVDRHLMVYVVVCAVGRACAVLAVLVEICTDARVGSSV